MPEQELNFIINATNMSDKAFKEVESGISGIQKKLKNMEPAFKKMAVAGTVAFGAIVAEVGFAMKAYADSETAMARVDQSLANIQKTSKMTADAIGKVKDSIMSASKAAVKLGFDDEDATESMTKFYGRTKDVIEAQKLMALAMDLSRAKNIALSDSTNMINMALSGNGKILKQYGIDIKDSATPLEAVNTLIEKVGGQSTAFAGTLAGKMEVLKVQFGNIQETIGKPFADAMSIILTQLNPVILKIGEWIEQHPKLTTAIIVVAGAIAGLTVAISTLALAVIFFQAVSWPIVGIVALITIGVAALAVAIGFVVYEIITHWTYLSDTTVKIVTGIKNMLKKTWDGVVADVTDRFNNLMNFFKGVWDAINQIIKDAVNTALDNFKPLLDAIQKIQSGLSFIGGKVQGGLNWVGNTLGVDALKVKDAIVKPNGEVIQTDPADYLIATKNPSALAGAGNITVNILGGYYLSENVAEDMGNKIIEKLKRVMKI